MRLDVLSEIPAEWSAQVHRWHRATRAFKRVLADGRTVPDANEEYLLYQTLVGAVPFALQTEAPDSNQLAAFRQRINGYMDKAVHEAKVNLSWVNSDPEYISALEQFIEKLYSPRRPRQRNTFWQQFTQFMPAVSYFGCINSLALLTLKLGAPGVPDIYQGNEVWDFSLVDPDNRRPVDFAGRQELLRDLLSRSASTDYVSLCRELMENWQDGRIKLWTTMRGLQFLREHRELFRHGAYVPLESSGAKREHAIAFGRLEPSRDEMAVVVAPRFAYTLMKGAMRPPMGDAWDDARIHLPRSAPTHFVNVFTGEILERQADGTLSCREIFRSFPVAVLAGR